MRLVIELFTWVSLFNVEVFSDESFETKISLAARANNSIIFVVVYFSLADISRLECDQVWLSHNVSD